MGILGDQIPPSVAKAMNSRFSEKPFLKGLGRGGRGVGGTDPMEGQGECREDISVDPGLRTGWDRVLSQQDI